MEQVFYFKNLSTQHRKNEVSEMIESKNDTSCTVKTHFLLSIISYFSIPVNPQFRFFQNTALVF